MSRITAEQVRPLVAARLQGRNANGASRDAGIRFHAIESGSEFGESICGATPGLLSGGWHEVAGATVTCPRCLRKLKATQP